MIEKLILVRYTPTGQDGQDAPESVSRREKEDVLCQVFVAGNQSQLSILTW